LHSLARGGLGSILNMRPMVCLLTRVRAFTFAAVALATGAATPTLAQTTAPSPAAPPTGGQWAVNFEPANLFVAPDDASEGAGSLRPLTYLQVAGYEGVWAKVYNPRTNVTAYLHSDQLGPSDPPPAYVTAPPPPAVEAVNEPARIGRGGASLAYYPTPDEDAQTDHLGLNASVSITDAVIGDDGETWYRTADGDYLAQDAVRLPRTPPRTFPGRWLDADLADPAMVTAYDGDHIVWSTLTIKGSPPRPTPTGVFSIIRRVANETMNSDTIGIPRFGPGGYYLTNVLFTQYFTADGASIHYNYWSANWGHSASHGCLGMTYADSSYLWSWASLGTLVSVHY